MKVYLVFHIGHVDPVGAWVRAIFFTESLARDYIKDEYGREVEDISHVNIQEWEITKSIDQLFDECILIGGNEVIDYSGED